MENKDIILIDDGLKLYIVIMDEDSYLVKNIFDNDVFTEQAISSNEYG